MSGTTILSHACKNPYLCAAGGAIVAGEACGLVDATKVENAVTDYYASQLIDTLNLLDWLGVPVYNESDEGSSPSDKKLSPGEIDKLKGKGVDPHDLKPKKQGSKYDLFKDKNGNIVVKPKKGNGPGDPTGLNINDF